MPKKNTRRNCGNQTKELRNIKMVLRNIYTLFALNQQAKINKRLIIWN